MIWLNDTLSSGKLLFRIVWSLLIVVFSASDDSLAKATVCKDNDDPGAPPAVEDQVKTEDKSPEDKSDTDIMVDMATLRQKAKQNVIAREKERAQIQSEKPHSPMKEAKARKNKK